MQAIEKIDFFPLSVVTGPAFCNRVKEIDTLKSCINLKRPVLLVSPRRYGKTSLVLNVIEKLDLPYANLDLFSVIDEKDIETVILNGISQLIFKIERIPKKALVLAKQIFKNTEFHIAVSDIDLAINFKSKIDKPAYRILDILDRLERLANHVKKPIVLFFDEFQSIDEATPNYAIESVLRQVAQLTKKIAFVFSGSNRHLLNQLFNDRNRPFYKLCERMSLDRISEAAYEKHIQIAAQQRWQQTLSARVLENIFFFTARHPYYMNLLCSRLWREKFPTENIVQQIWRQYNLEERSSVAAEIQLLSRNQRKLLAVLSRTGGANAPLGQHFIQQANMSKTTIKQAITFLEKRDYVYYDEQSKLKVLDPLIQSVLSDFLAI
ncbi:MAG: ATP-binding protein [Pseudomonadota bacterium]